MDPKLIEMKLRADPEMSKRVLAAQGQYDIRFRIDKPYRKVVVTWTELVGYSRADGKHEGERAARPEHARRPENAPAARSANWSRAPSSKLSSPAPTGSAWKAKAPPANS